MVICQHLEVCRDRKPEHTQSVCIRQAREIRTSSLRYYGREYAADQKKSAKQDEDITKLLKRARAVKLNK